jgi:hypothetical protein
MQEVRHWKNINWYTHVPKSACEHEDVTVFWNQELQTNTEVLANVPNIKKGKVVTVLN